MEIICLIWGANDKMTVIMPDANMMNNQSFLIIILLIIILQLRRRRIRIWTLLIMPVLISIVTIPLVSSELSSAFNVVIIFVALLMGLLVGFIIGKFMEVKIDEDGTMILKGSYIAIFLWIAVILMKIYGENVLSGTGWIEISLLTSAALVMALGAMISRRIFVYWKYMNFKKKKITSRA